MLTAKHHHYLSIMGIQIWLAKYYRFNLLSSQNELVGELLLENCKIEAQGEVFKLLDAMLKAIDLHRESAVPLIASCKIRIIMGLNLARQMLNTQQNLDELREANLHYPDQQTALLITYHPMHLLQHSNDKRKAWQDLQKLKKVLR